MALPKKGAPRKVAATPPKVPAGPRSTPKPTGPDFSDVRKAINGMRTNLDRLKRELRSKQRAVKAGAKAEQRELERQKRSGASPRDVPLVPGRSVLKEYHIDKYSTYPNRPGDKLAGHEMLQNAWINLKVKGSSRGVGEASRSNPAVALSKEMHDAVGREQRKLGLFEESKLKKMTYQENIALNERAMQNAGVPQDVIQVLKSEALRHAATLVLRK